jgi:hypothetical protein
MDARLIFCDFAEVSGGKLFIAGAAISLVGTAEPNPPFPLTAALAVLVTVPSADVGRPHRLTVELLGPSGQRVAMTATVADTIPGEQGLVVHPFMVEGGPGLEAGDEVCVPLVVPLVQFPLPDFGPYTFSAFIDDVEMDRSRFRLVPFTPGETPGQ